MGVPAFFRWLTKKYPSVIVHCIEEKVIESELNVFVVKYFMMKILSSVL
jgi:5'-3' exonuclease